MTRKLLDPFAPLPRFYTPRQARGRAATLALHRDRERRPEWIDVREIRERMGITQVRFARMFAIPTATLRHWESRERKPRGPALVLLHVIAREPQAVLRALKRNQFRRSARRAIELEDVGPVTERRRATPAAAG